MTSIPTRGINGGTSCAGSRGSSVASKATQDTNASLNLFMDATKGEELSSRAYRRIIEEAIQVIESLQKAKVTPSKPTQTGHSDENFAMAKILQEIKGIKATIAQNHVPMPAQGRSWAKVASKGESYGTTIRIQDEQEKKEIAKLSSEELVKKIGVQQIIGARQMTNGQVKVYFAGEGTKELMEHHKEWTTNLAASAQVAGTVYQVLMHDMPLSFEPENPEHLKQLQKANHVYIQGMTIQRAAWLKKNQQFGKRSGSLILWIA